MYWTFAMGQLAARQPQLESESTNIASDNAPVIEAAMQVAADT
jgi:hypothetical protein